MNVLKIIKESVDGNFESFHMLASLSNRQIIDELKKERDLKDEITLYLQKKTLCQVLQQYKQSMIKPELLQKWADLMREGRFETNYGEEVVPDTWLDVVYGSEYDSEHDTELWNEMNDIIFRLHEIGDLLDGEIKEEELEDWLNNFCKDICKTQ